MRKLKDLMTQNEQTMSASLALANKARETGKQAQMILKTRKAGRMQESNMKLSDLYRKMEILYRVLTKMYENSEILLEDIQDQVQVKKIERKPSGTATRPCVRHLTSSREIKTSVRCLTRPWKPLPTM